jgi:ABC-type branched-subunit amino acid transport system ATPase component
MTNQLSFATIHKSITEFDTIDLPHFVVLTGTNGSGKTHLLTGIKEGHIRSSLVGDINLDVRLFDSNSIIPQDTGMFDPYSEHSRKFQWFNTVKNHREQHLPSVRQFVTSLGIPHEYTTSIAKISSITVEKLKEILNAPERAEEIHGQIQNYLQNVSSQIYMQSNNQIGDDHWRKAAPKLAQRNVTSFLKSSLSEFFDDESFLWGEVDPFQHAFGRMFATYRDLIHANDRLEKYAPDDGSSRRFLNKHEFVRKHGEPPWDFVNRILEECALDFRVDHPPLYENAAYEPRLQKISSDVEMRFQDLSSGEKVLMSFALCLYNSQESRQAKVFPKLLLLDEVDAPLHPSMSASLLKTIQNVLVRDKNVAVILTTHSPSTVALAPDDAIFVMRPTSPRLQKTSKSAALALLTAGVPTLSVAFGGRRQVFVESKTDASLYDKLYQKYKAHVESERSLTFIEVGNKDKSGGEQNSGCVQVIRLVEELSNGGNDSVYGLVDWDGQRMPNGRVRVLSHGIRDGLENLLFDPVLIIAMAVRENLRHCKELRLINEGESYASVLLWPASRWQLSINVLQQHLIGNHGDDAIEIRYLNNMTLKVQKTYLHLDDHELEQSITKIFGYFQPRNKRAGDLMRHCVDTVLTDNPLLIPLDLLGTFDDLLSCS